MSETISSWLRRTWYDPDPTSSGKYRLLFHPLLLLGARFYATALRQHQFARSRRKRRLPATVVSIGNLVVGGTGKTPFALWLARYLVEKQRRPAILSRGYGSKCKGTALVAPEGASLSKSLLYGDEPVLMALKAGPVPVWVGRERLASGEAAIRTSKANVLILDDGFQHLSLERDLDLVLVDAQNPFGNGCLLPLGPLREPVHHLGRADAVILTRGDTAQEVFETQSKLERLFPRKPVFSCRHRLVGLREGLNGPELPLHKIQGRPAVAFAGIARPETFFRSLGEIGIDLCSRLAFPDHHAYSHSDIALLLQEVRRSKAHFLITTEKDYVRLPHWAQSIMVTAELDLSFDSQYESFSGYLDEQLGLE